MTLYRKKCKFCGKLKTSSHFGTGKKYCSACFNLYMKHFTQGGHACHKERENLIKHEYFHDDEVKRVIRIIISVKDEYPASWKKFRKYVRYYPKHKVQLDSMLNYYSTITSFFCV